jgi:hypothetical protein
VDDDHPSSVLWGRDRGSADAGLEQSNGEIECIDESTGDQPTTKAGKMVDELQIGSETLRQILDLVVTYRNYQCD